MKPAKKTYAVLCLVILIAVACGPVTAVPIPTEIIKPTSTVVPTHTSLPEPSPTATLSQVDKSFILPTRHPFGDTTPTPIATPAFNISAARLRTLSEDEAFHLILEMHEYSYRNFPSSQDWWTDGQFIASQEPVALTIQEYLYHFPESPNADRLRWQLAFINSIMYDGLAGNQYGDEWMLGELENSLNHGETAPDQLGNILSKYWFDVTYSQPMENLFADNKTGWLYQVIPQVWAGDKSTENQSFAEGSMFFVVREDDRGKFEIYLLNSAWNLSFGDSFIFDTTDHNQNGTPDVALYIGSHSGTMCGGNLLVYEWNEENLVELTKNKVYLRDCGEDFEYSMVENVPAITFYGFMPARTEQYVWNGEHYEFAGYESTSLVDKWWSARTFPEEAEAIEALLSSGDKEGLTPSQIDFLRFRLGIVYALNSDPAQVNQVLQDLVDHAEDETRTIYSDFARNFLRYYSGDKSLFLACRKSREMFDAVNNSSENIDELLGIPFDFIFGPGRLRCFDSDVFELLITKLPVTVENVPAELRDNGMDLYYAEKRDVNLDGITDEWLVIFEDGTYVIASDGTYYNAIQLEYFWYVEDVNQYSNVEIKIERWTGIQDPIMTVKTDRELSILSIGDGYNTTELNSELDAKDVVFSSQNTPPEYQAFFIKPDPGEEYFGIPWTGYRWDSNSQKFQDDLIEYTLFIEHDPDEAFKIATVVEPFLIDWKDLDAVDYWLPRYLYLCGLAYELSGDTQMAAETYWHIWHDFPDSHYARLAKFKLEPVSP